MRHPIFADSNILSIPLIINTVFEGTEDKLKIKICSLLISFAQKILLLRNSFSMFIFETLQYWCISKRCRVYLLTSDGSSLTYRSFSLGRIIVSTLRDRYTKCALWWSTSKLIRGNLGIIHLTS